MVNSTIEEIHQVFLKNRGVSIDTRTLQKDDLFFALSGPNFNGNMYANKALELGAIAVVVDDPELAGVQKGDDRFLYVSDSLVALQSLATLHRDQSNAQIIGVTGSNGKTTTKELLATVLGSKFDIIYTKGNLNNHIGVPLTLLTITESTEIAIVEMGANHIGEIRDLCGIAKPDFGLITNIGKAHIEGFGSLEGIKQGKRELYQAINRNEGLIFVNSDDHVLMDLAKENSWIITYSADSSFGSTKVSCCDNDGFLEVSFDWKKAGYTERMNLYGDYNFSNILAALNIGYYFHIAPPISLKVLSAYTPNNSRSQRIETKFNKVYLDAYNANPTSMEYALKAFANLSADNKLVILGDMFELGHESHDSHQNIADLAMDLFDDVFLVGEHFGQVDAQGVKFKSTADLQKHLKKSALRQKTILLKGSRGMALEELLDVI